MLREHVGGRREAVSVGFSIKCTRITIPFEIRSSRHSKRESGSAAVALCCLLRETLGVRCDWNDYGKCGVLLWQKLSKSTVLMAHRSAH